MTTDQTQHRWRHPGQTQTRRATGAGIVIATTMAAALTSCAPTETATLEIAVYTARSPEQHSAIRAETRKRLSQEAGFLWWRPLKIAPPGALPNSPDDGESDHKPADEMLFADVLAWESIAAAKAAAEKVASDPAYGPFVESIADIRHFTHYRAWNAAGRLNEILTGARFIEIAAYTVQDAEQHLQAQRLLYEEKFPGRSGLAGGARLRRLDAERAFGDLLGWQSVEAWQATGAAMMADPDLKPFFEGIDESIVFALFIEDAGGTQ
ncbi:MAG: hypothetical protein NXI24_19505 [bacterium]|nr:hypothetical protein [bacterium]